MLRVAFTPQDLVERIERHESPYVLLVDSTVLDCQGNFFESERAYTGHERGKLLSIAHEGITCHDYVGACYAQANRLSPEQRRKTLGGAFLTSIETAIYLGNDDLLSVSLSFVPDLSGRCLEKGLGVVIREVNSGALSEADAFDYVHRAGLLREQWYNVFNKAIGISTTHNYILNRGLKILLKYEYVRRILAKEEQKLLGEVKSLLPEEYDPSITKSCVNQLIRHDRRIADLEMSIGTMMDTVDFDDRRVGPAIAVIERDLDMLRAKAHRTKRLIGDLRGMCALHESLHRAIEEENYEGAQSILNQLRKGKNPSSNLARDHH